MASAKQLQREIDALAAENKQLRADRAHLESRLDAMDKRLAALDGGPVRTADIAGSREALIAGAALLVALAALGARRRRA